MSSPAPGDTQATRDEVPLRFPADSNGAGHGKSGWKILQQGPPSSRLPGMSEDFFGMMLSFTGYSEQTQEPGSGFSVINMMNKNPETGLTMLETCLAQGMLRQESCWACIARLEC